LYATIVGKERAVQTLVLSTITSLIDVFPRFTSFQFPELNIAMVAPVYDVVIVKTPADSLILIPPNVVLVATGVSTQLTALPLVLRNLPACPD
jgi:hypothetical protein